MPIILAAFVGSLCGSLRTHPFLRKMEGVMSVLQVLRPVACSLEGCHD